MPEAWHGLVRPRLTPQERYNLTESLLNLLAPPEGVRWLTKCDDCGDDLALLPEHKQGDRYVCPLCRLITTLRPETP